jgi:hypothetical protein
MDEGTIKTPIPKGRLHKCFCFVDSESGQKQSGKLLQHLPPPHCLYKNTTFTLGRGGGVGEVREKVEGQQFTRGVENTNMTDCISSL